MERWKQFISNLYPDDDLSKLEKYCKKFNSLEDYMKSPLFGDPKDKFIHIGLTPTPFVGDLDNASIYMLMLNPGLNTADYLQLESEVFIRAFRENLNQIPNRKYPFYYLNPQLCNHPGYNYWTAKLKDLIGKVREAKIEGNNTPWLDAQEWLSKRIALLELVPYHSKKGNYVKRASKGLKN